MENPFRQIQKILDYKKQVILYGPPGTGKTYIANEFVKEKNLWNNEKQSEKDDKKFFWYITNLKNWGSELQNELQNMLENNEESEIWTKGEDGEYLKDKSSFFNIKNGDIVFVYITPEKRLYGISKCSRKEVDSVGDPLVSLSGLKFFEEGLSLKKIKTDPILQNAKRIHSNLGTLFPLTRKFGLRLLELSQVTPEEVGISTPEKKERSPLLCNFVTFHPSYAYEEFIEGLRPNAEEGGNIRYEIQEGIFKRASREALNALLEVAEIDRRWQDHSPVPAFTPEESTKILSVVDKVPCYLVIDEINRGDISRIFGELITLVEADKRLFCENEMRCILPYSKMEFGIPPNLFILGTMNTADRSISLMDIALRRRFGFIELLPDYDLLAKILINDQNLSEDVKEYRRLAIQSLISMNERITEIYDRDHQIGHSYLLKLSQDSSVEDTKETLTNIWKFEIIPLLQEYFYDSPEKLLYITNNRFFEKRGSSFILKTEGDLIEVLRAVATTK
jgi:5-methylcytosine-specific restriction protein B